AIAGLSLFAASMSRCSPGATAPAIGVGERREAALSSSDSDRRVLHRGPEARWSFHGQSGQRISILAESYEFDVCLVLLDSQNQRVAFAEDNAGFFNARLNQVLKRDETLTIVVAGTNVDQAGTYWLTVDEDLAEVDWSRPSIEAYYRNGLEWASREKNRRAECWLDLGMGKYLAERRAWDEAERYLSAAQSSGEESGFIYGRYAVALERGSLSARRRKYDQALSEFQAAHDLSEQLQGKLEAEA